MKDITLEELLEAGCHFGHQVNRRNPKADEFIFEAREGVNIINLESTRDGLLEAARFIKDTSEKGGYLCLVGTKRQARPIVEELILKAREDGAKNLFYVTSRWIGGTLTNFEEIKKNHKKLKNYADLLSQGKSTGYTKRELTMMDKEKNKLERLYGGIKDMDRIPDALFIIDTHLETTAISEARIMNVATAGIVDTNADPGQVDHVIPANDDAVGSIRVITQFIVDAWCQGQKEQEKKLAKEQKRVEDEKKKSENTEEKKSKMEEEKPAQTEVKTTSQKSKVE